MVLALASVSLRRRANRLLINFTYLRLDSILRFPYETRARALGNFCRPVRPQISSASLTMQRYEIFRCKTIVAGDYFRFISNVKMTNEARAEPNLFELCLARRNSTKCQMTGQRDNGTKGHLCFRFFNSDKNCLLKLLYILLIYILIIYIIIHKNHLPTYHTHTRQCKTHLSQCPFVPLSHVFLL